MTGIARDEALRGDALVDALASSEKKTERDRMRGGEYKKEREKGQIEGNLTGAENEDTQRHAEEKEKERERGR